jgi:HAE1 family hydrophobic/amphiphilic exporter-1
MLAASCFGIFVIPMLYVVFQSLRERVSRPAADRPAAEASPGD